MALPNMTQGRLDVLLERRTITARGTSVVSKASDGNLFPEVESASSFRKSFKIPGHAPLKDFQTDYNNGLLKITVFKASDER